MDHLAHVLGTCFCGAGAGLELPRERLAGTALPAWLEGTWGGTGAHCCFAAFVYSLPTCVSHQFCFSPHNCSLGILGSQGLPYRNWGGGGTGCVNHAAASGVTVAQEGMVREF